MSDCTRVRIEKDGYEPVECDVPLPCPFCGATPELAQMAHMTHFRNGKAERVILVASSRTLTADTFWFKCPECRATTGPHCGTAQEAVKHWNKRDRGD